tara:strand:+ start:573 stop:968 length:396 start_codon:yes stop_codon:yes gene_type:complete
MRRNKVNGKVYIGLTSKSAEKRWSAHCKRAKYLCRLNNGNYFQRAIVKYGKESWELEILELCYSLEDAEKAEAKWIKHYKSSDKRFGYNLTDGGSVSHSSLDPRVRQKISRSVSKIVNNPVTKQADEAMAY